VKRTTVITVLAAATVAGGGVAYGATQNDNQAPTTAPQVAPVNVQQGCEQLREQIRKDHPDAYLGDCNSGEATLTP
jgi:hypothetical protein